MGGVGFGLFGAQLTVVTRLPRYPVGATGGGRVGQERPILNLAHFFPGLSLHSNAKRDEGCEFDVARRGLDPQQM